MKHTILSLVAIIFFSCSDDITIVEIIEDDGDFVELELNKTFLLGEKWYLESIIADEELDLNGDNIASEELITEVPLCDLDSFYEFEKEEEDFVVLDDNETVCEDFISNYGFGSYTYKIIPDGNSIEFETNGFKLLGGLRPSQGPGLTNTKCLMSRDSSFKLLKFDVIGIINFLTVRATYVLRADINDRPD